jgi:hypothetical protein
MRYTSEYLWLYNLEIENRKNNIMWIVDNLWDNIVKICEE